MRSVRKPIRERGRTTSRRLVVAPPSPARVRRIEEKLGRGARGKIVALDPSSDRYFVGRNVIEAARKGRRELGDPSHKFFFIRLGSPAVHWHAGPFRGDR